MTSKGRVVTANLPQKLAARLDKIAARRDRSKSWIVCQALDEWLAEEERRHELTLEALRDVDEGRTFTHEEVLERAARLKQERRRQHTTAPKPAE